MTEKITLEEGSIINERYTLKKLVNISGACKTFLAIENHSRIEVIIKILLFSEIEDWKTREFFEREVEILKNLNHKNIPHFIDSFKLGDETEELFLLVMEYKNGSTLYDVVCNGKLFSYEEILHIIDRLLKIISYIHRLCPILIHRDINPKNVIMSDKNEVSLIDFGSAVRMTETEISADGTFIGTIGYMPDEQMMGNATTASDIYALGMTIIFLLTGKEPFEFELIDNKVNFHPFVKIPENLLNLIDSMIEPSLENRVKDADSALEIFNSRLVSGKLKAHIETDKFFEKKDIPKKDLKEHKSVPLTSKVTPHIPAYRIVGPKGYIVLSFDWGIPQLNKRFLQKTGVISIKNSGKIYFDFSLNLWKISGSKFSYGRLRLNKEYFDENSVEILKEGDEIFIEGIKLVFTSKTIENIEEIVEKKLEKSSPSLVLPGVELSKTKPEIIYEKKLLILTGNDTELIVTETIPMINNRYLGKVGVKATKNMGTIFWEAGEWKIIPSNFAELILKINGCGINSIYILKNGDIIKIGNDEISVTLK